jgi:large subunit ribosomal protein L25
MQLAAQKRDVFGKKLTALRSQGLIPAELYGHGSPNVHLAVSTKDFTNLLRTEGTATLVDLVVDGVPQRVLIQDMQHDPQESSVVHIDFYAVKKGEKIRTEVPLVFAGESPAVQNEGGVLVKALHEIEVEALPEDLPHEIRIDLSALAVLDTSIHIKDLKLPHGVHVDIDPETVVVSVTPQRAEEVPLPAEENLAEVKVEAEEKKAERDAGKEGAQEEGGKASAE